MDLLHFSLYNSLAVFNGYTNVLEYVMRENDVPDMLHYLNDYFTTILAESLVLAEYRYRCLHV